MARTSPFDFISSIVSRGKEDLMATEPDNEKAYLPFIINRQFSYFPDTVLLANEMNGSGVLDNRLQYDFYRSTVRPKKRFAKWVKCEQSDDVDTVAEYYHMNKDQAREALKILKPEALVQMRKKLSRGGLSRR